MDVSILRVRRLCVAGAVVVGIGGSPAVAQCIPTPEGLVSWWDADEVSGGTVFDLQGLNDGLLSGATTVPGFVGQAFGFDGVDDFVEVADAPSLKPPSAMTLEFWAKATSIGFDPIMVGKFDQASNSGYLIQILTSGKVRYLLRTSDAGLILLDSVQTVGVNQFIHFALTYDGSAMRGYINGVEAAFVPTTGSIVHNSLPLITGALIGSSFTRHFNGLIDEVGIYDRALVAAEVQAIHDVGNSGKCKDPVVPPIPPSPSPCIPAPAGLVSWWDADAVSGGTVFDLQGLNDGLLSGATTVPGLVGQAFSFDGVDDFVEVADAPSLKPPSAMTLEFWAMATSIGFDPIMVGKFDQASNSGYLIQILTSGKVRYVLRTSDTGLILLDSLQTVGVNQFIHFALTYDGSAMRGYINGVEAAFVPTTGSIVHNSLPLITGALIGSSFTRHFNGLIDEVGIYDRALVAAEVQVIHDAGNGGKCKFADDPPVAVAGPSQAVHAGQTVLLDGSSSFDDNTSSQDLVFDWSIIESPPGSSAALAGPGTATPSFVADLAGSYVVQLVVIDEVLQASVPDELSVSSLNVVPTSDAGVDQIGVVGQVVDLDGGSSRDADGDPLLFDWTIVQAPVGSTSTLNDPSLLAPSFVPDVVGEYTVQLVVRDGISSSPPDTVAVSAITGLELAQLHLMDALDLLNGLPIMAFDAKGHKKSMGTRISQVIRFLEAGQLLGAFGALEQVLRRVDGCALRGAADPKGQGQPFAADHVVTCTDQEALFAFLSSAAEALGQ